MSDGTEENYELLIGQLQAELATRDERIRELEGKVKGNFDECVGVGGHCDQIRTLEAERDNLRGELDETFTDDRGTVWRRPTPWAYAQSCRALERMRGLVEELRSALTDASVTLDEIATAGKKWDYPNVRTKLKEALAHAEKLCGTGPTTTATPTSKSTAK